MKLVQPSVVERINGVRVWLAIGVDEMDTPTVGYFVPSLRESIAAVRQDAHYAEADYVHIPVVTPIELMSVHEHLPDITVYFDDKSQGYTEAGMIFTCIRCHTARVFAISYDALHAYLQGLPVAQAFPELTPADWLALDTGLCNACRETLERERNNG